MSQDDDLSRRQGKKLLHKHICFSAFGYYIVSMDDESGGENLMSTFKT